MVTKLANKRNSANATAFAELCIQLHRGAFSQVQLSKKVGITVGTAATWLAMLKRRKLIYVKHFKSTEAGVGPYTAYWAWGYMEPDAVKPKPLTDKELNDRSNIRKKLRREAAKKAALLTKATQLLTSGTLGDISGTPG